MPGTPPRRIRSCLAAAAVVGSALLLTSCQAAEPTVVETPKISWEDGAPSTALDSDPFVVAARASTLGFVLAYNSRDFTIAQVTDTMMPATIDDYYENYLREYVTLGSPAPSYVGPFPELALDVIPSSDGASAEVVFCELGQQWYVSTDHPEASYVLSDAVKQSAFIVTDPADGKLKLARIGASGIPCDPTGVSVGRFDPAPAPIDRTLGTSDVRAPLTT